MAEVIHGHDADYGRVAEIVWSGRVVQGLSKTQAATKAGVSVSVWRLVEGGSHRQVSDRTLVRMADALGLQPDDLLFAAGRKLVGSTPWAPVGWDAVPSGLASCPTCAAVVLDTEAARQQHEEWHARIDGGGRDGGES